MSNIAQTLNVYYTAAQYISPSSQQAPALVDEKLIYPIIKDASQFQVGLVKAKVPLDTIPLTQANIPFHAWEIELRKGNASGNAYVKQLNASTTNIIWKSNVGKIQKSTYSNSGVLVSLGIFDISEWVPYIGMFVVDDYENLYVIGSETLNGLNTLFYVFSNDALTQYVIDTSYSDLQCIAIDPFQNIYLASLASGVFVFSNVNSDTGVALTLTTTITNDSVGSLTNVVTVCSDSTTVIGYANNKISMYDSLYSPISAPISLTEISSLGNQSAILGEEGVFILSDVGASRLLVGQAFGTGTVDNMNTATSFVAGVWDQNTQMCMSTWSGVNPVTCYAVAGSQLWNFLYNTETGVCASPSAQGDLTTITNCSNGVLAGDCTASNGSLFYYLTQHAGLTFQQVSSLFKISGSVSISAYSNQQTGGNMIALGSDSNLYISDIPMYPKQFLVNDSTLSSTGVVSYQGVSNVIFPGTSTNSTAIRSCAVPNISGLTTITSYIEGSYMYVLGSDPISGEDTLTQYDYPSGTFVNNLHLNFLSPIVDSNMCMGPLPGTCCYVAYFGGAMNLYIINTTGTVPSSPPLMSILANSTPITVATPAHKISVCSCNLTTDNCGVVAISDNTTNYIYRFDSATTYNLTFQCSANPGGLLSTWGMFFTQKTQSSTTTQLYMYGSNNLSNNSSATWLFTSGFAAIASGVDIASAYQFIASAPLEPSLTFTSGAYQEGYAPVISDGYKLVSLDLSDNNSRQSGLITLATGTTSFCVAPSLDGLFTFSGLTVSGVPNPIISVSVDPINPTLIYCCDNTGLVYSGHLIGTAIVFSSVLNPTIDGTYQTILPLQLPTNSMNAVGSVVSYSISNQAKITKISYSTNVSGIGRNLINGEFVVCTDSLTNNLISYPATTLSPQNWMTTSIPAGGGCIFTKNSENIDAGPAPIYTYQVLIDAINIAFAEAFKIANINGAGLLSPPSISMDFSTGLCTLNYDAEYVNNVNGILTSTDGILFNSNLNSLLKFNSQPDSITPSMYLVYLTENSPTAPYSVQQTSKSITTFNMLDKILFSSTTIYVSQSFFGNNQANNILTDVDIDTSGMIENSGWLLYQPNFLRPFALASNNAIDRIQLYVSYSYIDGTVYPLLINPGSGWNAKLDFIRKYQF